MSLSWKRHRIAALALALGLAVAGYFGYWLTRLEDYRGRMSAVLGQATPPFTLKGGAVSYGGFPIACRQASRTGRWSGCGRTIGSYSRGGT
ncbi:hypothetical protein E6W36_12930 [Hankyongella ginsenosidimutans]|uniref:Uncharacterized protein n=1 Tax=Hankyongella ginsenosidimutans TaxID=1763828 RepID=A0A4D7C906_9SPHN|nr:hypothetical protein [Hankyongella ginsenosidimutans]QCI80088.1 hypothetical protein E6W36_12930 [Hankyongella ginsenosidimutans]